VRINGVLPKLGAQRRQEWHECGRQEPGADNSLPALGVLAVEEAP
jgi:hypothetical protein